MESLVNVIEEAGVLQGLADFAIDAALTQGIVLRPAETPHSSAVVEFAPFCLFPSPVPKDLYDQAVAVQSPYNLLYHRIAEDEDFLRETLEKTRQVDPFVGRLWEIYRFVRAEGVAQKLQLGIHRSDYMVDIVGEGDAEDGGISAGYRLTQIEMNTIASAFGCLSTRLFPVHRQIVRRVNDAVAAAEFPVDAVPENDVTGNLARGLLLAVDAYIEDRDESASVKELKPAILFVCEEVWRTVLDQRLLEYAIYERRKGLVVLRKTLLEVELRGRLDEVTKILTIDGYEVCLAYFRIGYAPTQYPSELHWKGRLKIERSLAVKCPSIGYHLVTTKKVQQAIAAPGILERFLDDRDTIQQLRQTFTGLYPLDDSAMGSRAISLARSDPSKFVLKPQREGGANNFYGDDIPQMLDQICRGDGKDKAAYILMDRVSPMEHFNVILRPGAEVKVEKMVSELGIFGVFLIRDEEVLMNEFAGHLVRTKPSHCDEGGVAAGFAGLNSPFLK